MAEETVIAEAPAPAPTPAPAPEPAPSPSPAPSPAPSPSPSPVPAPADDKIETKGFWPETWRENIAKEDAKLQKILGRYASPDDVAKALVAAQDKIRSGELMPVLAKDAKPEEVAEYRKAMGIPETPDKYVLKDVKIDAAEKPFVDKLMEAAHASNQTPAQVAATVNTWHAIREAALEEQGKKDEATAKASEDALRAEWGTDFRRNLNIVHGLLDGSGDAKLKANLLEGRLADGTPVGSSPQALKMLLGVALKDNPAGIVVPGSSGDPAKNVDQRIAEIEKMMREDRKAYNKPEISGTDGEYQKLLKVRDSLKARL